MPLHDRIRVDEKSVGQRLDQFLNERYPEHTRSYFTKHIKDGSILVNGKSEKPGYKLNAHDRITIEIESRPLDLTPAPEIDFDIIYEDEAILVVNKPAGLTVHPGKGSEGDTLVNALLDLRLETGRTHQIRLHMSHLGYPLVGDPDYNGRDKQLARLPQNLRKRGQHMLKLLPYQFLHAQRLSFIHPLSDQTVQFESALPETLQSVLDKLPDLFLLEGG